jgi:hypothetical protein
MINLNFSIANPTKFKDFPIKDFNYWIDRTLSKNKSFEFQAVKFNAYNIFSFRFSTNLTGHDHAGPEIAFEFCGIIVEMRIYDHRHWDHKLDTWEKN